jgi:ferredoxin/flavodoxin---NADP+ reductase
VLPLEYNATVIQRLEIAPGLMILRVVPDRQPFDFEAGQYAVLGLKRSAPRAPGSDPDPAADSSGPSGDGEKTREGAADAPDRMIRRAYSIASSSKVGEYLEFYLAMVPSGELSPRLFAVAASDRLYLGPKATGLFTLRKVPRNKHIYLVGTGTGLAPYMSMLRSEVECEDAQRLVVLHGARYSYDLAYRAELMTLARRCSNLSYFPVVSRPQADPTWSGLTGYLQDVLLSGVIEERSGVRLDPETAHVFLCGNPSMIVAAKTRLISERGYVPDLKKIIGDLHLEEFW